MALLELMLEEKIDVKPAKVVAGLEPERTNIMLQALFRAATSGIDSGPYIQKLMGGEEAEDNGEQ